MNRCILLFPEFSNMSVIDSIRQKYDPAYSLVPPHVTLVFPFESDLADKEIREHMRNSLAGQEPFLLSLQGISSQKSFGNYLLLNVHTGKNTVKDIHRRLYTGILEQYKPLWCRTFEPHMTVGKVDTEAELHSALDELSGVEDCFEVCIRSIHVEIIGGDGSSIIESVLELPVL